MSTRTRVRFIVNPISGTSGKKHIVGLIPKYLSEDKFLVDVAYTSYAGHAAEIASASAAEGWDIVVAVGGDGTVNEVARSLIGTNTALGIVPCGSGNGLARHLAIPMNPIRALKIIADNCIKALDYGEINGTPFFCTCGVGFDAFVSDKFAQSGKRGLLTYVENTLKEGLNYKPDTYEIEVDGKCLQYKAFLIACGNASQYGNNVYITPDASMSDGLMDVTVMEPFNMLDAPQIAIQLFNKSITTNSHIHSFKCHTLRIHRSAPGVIHFDGDPKEESQDLLVKVVPGKIRMVVNKDGKSRQPLLLRTVMEIFNDVNSEIDSLRLDIVDGQKRINSINRELLNKLRNHKG